jgi:hypothetical protein
VADPVNRLYPKHIVPWLDFPQLQEQVWEKFDRTAAFTSRPLFPSDAQIDYVVTNIQNKPIYSGASLRNFGRDTVDNFVEKSLRLCETMNPFDRSLESEAESPSMVAQTHRKLRWRTAWSE